MGLWGSIADAAVGGVSGGVGSLVTTPFSLLEGEIKQRYNERNMKKQFEYNTQLQQQQADLDYSNWQKMFDENNEYNLPAKSVSRLMAAGINPFVDSSTAAPVAGSTTAPSTPPVAGGAVGLPASPSLSFSANLKTLVDAMKGANEIPYVKQKIQSEIDALLARARDDNAKAVINEITGNIQKELGFKTAEASLKLINKHVAEVQSIIDRNDFEGLKAWKEGLLADARASLESSKYAIFDKYANKLFALYDSQIRSNNAAANQSNTQAAVNREISTEKQLENGLNAVLYDGKIDQFNVQLDKLKSEKEITDSQVEVARAAAAVAQYEKDNAAMLFWRDFILETLGKSVDIVTAVRSWKNISSYSSLSESKKREVDLQVQKFDREILEKRAGKKVERTRRTSQGNIKETYYQNK